ncbi:MAG TPA: hypothetical protein DD490_12825 [Acidobacteria bacterium]|nr:hypothetical protein [Acidobacteriota bacterium]
MTRPTKTGKKTTGKKTRKRPALDFYRDEAGDPRARPTGGRSREKLAGFLESDIQGSATTGLEILAALESVEAGRLREWTQTGNAYTLILTPDGATLEPEADEGEEATLLPLADLREAVTRWVEFLAGGARH